MEQLEEISQNPQLQQALNYIEETDDQTIEDQVLLTEIPAPPFGEVETRQKICRDA
ncbi:MAG: hypothetical protein U5K69_05865 [Balneolaceae bacterium]|nr:hypothetical protein [Balneolaceae bacterium]